MSPSRNMKIIMMGHHSNSELIQRFTKKPFNQDYKFSVGVDILIKDIQYKSDEMVTLSIWDVTSAKRFDFIRTTFYKGAAGAILVFDIAEEDSWDTIRKYYYELRHFIGYKPTLLIGNHSDPSKKRVIDHEIPDRWAKERSIFYYEDINDEIFLDLTKTIIQANESELQIPLPKYHDLDISQDEIIQDIDFIIGKQIPKLKIEEPLKFGYRSEDGKITEIGIESCAINYLPNSFANLKYLRVLNLHDNQFKEIPEQLWNMEMLTELSLTQNPLDFESQQYVHNIEDIRKYARSKTRINIFISYSEMDAMKFHLRELAAILKKHEGIGEVFYFDQTQKGDIEYYMSTKVAQSQLILFIATSHSLRSKACNKEIDSAKEHKIMILPFLDKGLAWSDRDLHKIRDFRGIPKDPSRIEDPRDCWDELLTRIDDLKKEFNLFDRSYETIELLLTIVRLYLQDEKTLESLKNSDKIDFLIEKFKQKPKSRDKLLDYFVKWLFEQRFGPRKLKRFIKRDKKSHNSSKSG